MDFAQGATRAQIADIVFTSDEYRHDLVEDWYEHYFDRAADTGLAPVLAKLDAGRPMSK